MIQKLIDLIKSYKQKHNFNITFTLQSDGSCGIEEYWSEKNIKTFNNVSECIEFLKNR